MGPGWELELPRAAAAPGIARHSLAERFSGSVDAEQLQTAKLLVSELVTNAVVHGEGRIRLRAEHDGERLLIEVIDDGHGFEREARKRDFDELSGRGLAIVESESSRWGIHEGTTHVWFELEEPGPRLGADKKEPS